MVQGLSVHPVESRKFCKKFKENKYKSRFSGFIPFYLLLKSQLSELFFKLLKFCLAQQG